MKNINKELLIFYKFQRKKLNYLISKQLRIIMILEQKYITITANVCTN